MKDLTAKEIEVVCQCLQKHFNFERKDGKSLGAFDIEKGYYVVENNGTASCFGEHSVEDDNDRYIVRSETFSCFDIKSSKGLLFSKENGDGLLSLTIDKKDIHF